MDWLLLLALWLHTIALVIAVGYYGVLARIVIPALERSLHGSDLADVLAAGEAILTGLGAKAEDQLQPRILYSDVIEDITDQHAVIVNRNRQASMILPGDTLLVFEVTPALFAAVAANEAEKAAPGNTLVDVQMIGAAGRVYISGSTADVQIARERITKILGEIEGRAH